ncbi:Hypothetical predicted protein [Podarcis lilfordi]|uniref:Uncharacterized protein n=1 Tax=Podarcis lilfordi TaxID=74358 RepID=A0AA35JSP3_9SAUR|nr:Hypothetical predicted protein [Podarcis lilfordi]
MCRRSERQSRAPAEAPGNGDAPSITAPLMLLPAQRDTTRPLPAICMPQSPLDPTGSLTCITTATSKKPEAAMPCQAMGRGRPCAPITPHEAADMRWKQWPHDQQQLRPVQHHVVTVR